MDSVFTVVDSLKMMRKLYRHILSVVLVERMNYYLQK